MTVDASDLISRYVYPQSGNFRVLLEVDNMPSYLEFVLRSGGGDAATYTFDNKRFIDYLGNFSNIYETGGNFKFELVKSGAQINTWINDSLSQSYVKDAFFPSYIDRIDLNNPSTDTDFTLSFYGERPNLTFSNISTTDSVNYSGYIFNASRDTRILNISGQNIYSTYNELLTGNSTGYYSFSGNFVSGASELDLIFDFDFGTVEQRLDISDPNFSSQDNTSGFLNFAISNTIIGNDEFAAYSLSQYALSGMSVNVELHQTQRIGNSFGTGTGTGAGTFTGYLDGGGTVQSFDMTGIISGFPGSGYSSKFYYPSGWLISEYSITVTGYEGGNLSTGILDGYVSGLVGPGSGTYRFSGIAIGIPPVSIWYGGTNTTPVGTYTGQYNYIENLKGYFTTESTGIISKGAYTEIVPISDIRNNFNLSVGNLGDVLSDFATSGWNSGLYYAKTGGFSTTSGQFTDLEGRISYFSGVNGITDIAILSIYTDSDRYDVEIHGTLQDFSNQDRVFAGYRVVDEGGPTYKNIYYNPSTQEYTLE